MQASYSDVLTTSVTILTYCGLDVKTLVTYGVRPSFIKPLTDTIYNRAIALQKDTTNYSTNASLSSLAYTTCAIDASTNTFDPVVKTR